MTNDSKRRRLSRPYPQFPLKEIERIPKIIHSVRNGNEMDSTELATAMSKTAKSSEYRMMINAAKLYGLISGTYNTKISLLPLAEKIISPRNENEREIGLVEAALNPQTFRSLRDVIDNNELPKDSYLKNILEREIDIHHDLTEECLRIFKENLNYANIIENKNPVEIEEIIKEPGKRPKHEEKQTLIYTKHEKAQELQIQKLFRSLGLNYIQIEEADIKNQELSEEIKNKMRLCNSAIIEKNEDEISQQIIGAASILYDEKVIILGKTSIEEVEFINNLKSKNIIRISQNW